MNKYINQEPFMFWILSHHILWHQIIILKCCDLKSQEIYIKHLEVSDLPKLLGAWCKFPMYIVWDSYIHGTDTYII